MNRDSNVRFERQRGRGGGLASAGGAGRETFDPYKEAKMLPREAMPSDSKSSTVP